MMMTMNGLTEDLAPEQVRPDLASHIVCIYG